MKAPTYEEVFRFWYNTIPKQFWYYYEHFVLVENNCEFKKKPKEQHWTEISGAHLVNPIVIARRSLLFPLTQSPDMFSKHTPNFCVLKDSLNAFCQLY